MSTEDPIDALEALRAEGIAAFDQAGSAEAIETARIEFLGQKSGRLKSAQERLKTLEPSAKKAYGLRFNAAKQAVEAAFGAAKLRIERPSAVADAIECNWQWPLPMANPTIGEPQ